MAVQAGLLQSSIPMGAKPVDVTGSLDAAYNMRGDRVNAERAEQGLSRENEDRSILQNYLKSGGNITTPDGIDKALADLKGKVSSDSYLKLADHGQKQKESDAKYRADLQTLDVNNLNIRGAQLDQSVVYLSDPLKQYEENKPKGLQEAGAAFEAAKAKAVATARQQKGADGKQLYPEDVLQQISGATPETLQMLLAHTKYQQDLVKQRLEQSQTAEHDARAKAFADYGAGGPSALQKLENDHRRGLVTDEEYQTMKNHIINKGPTSALAKLDEDLAAGRINKDQYESMKKGIIDKISKPGEASNLEPEAIHNMAVAHYGGEPLPTRLSPRERGLVLNDEAAYAKELGDTSEEMALHKMANKSFQVARNQLQKQRTLVAGFERDAEKRLDLVVSLLDKFGQTAPPIIQRWINGGRTQIEGDVDVNTFNSAMISLQAELAKVLSGSLTNAGVSDAARGEAQQIINKTMTSDQIHGLVPNIKKELHFKLESYDEELASIQNAMAPHAKPGSPKAAADDKAKGESVRIYKDEAKKLRATMADPNASADDKARAKINLEGVLRELKSVGGTEDVAPAKPTAGGWSIRPVQ